LLTGVVVEMSSVFDLFSRKHKHNVKVEGISGNQIEQASTSTTLGTEKPVDTRQQEERTPAPAPSLLPKVVAKAKGPTNPSPPPEIKSGFEHSRTTRNLNGSKKYHLLETTKRSLEQQNVPFAPTDEEDAKKKIVKPSWRDGFLSFEKKLRFCSDPNVLMGKDTVCLVGSKEDQFFAHSFILWFHSSSFESLNPALGSRIGPNVRDEAVFRVEIKDGMKWIRLPFVSPDVFEIILRVRAHLVVYGGLRILKM
jgi:hypothetical protein